MIQSECNHDSGQGDPNFNHRNISPVTGKLRSKETLLPENRFEIHEKKFRVGTKK